MYYDVLVPLCIYTTNDDDDGALHLHFCPLLMCSPAALQAGVGHFLFAVLLFMMTNLCFLYLYFGNAKAVDKHCQ